MITVDIDDRQVTALMRAVAGKMSNLKPVMAGIGEMVTETTKRRFVEGVDPDGKKWPKNRPSTIKKFGRQGGKKPLIGESKSLATQINYSPGPDSVTIGSPKIYSVVQFLGAKRGAFGKTRWGVPLPWGDIPARRFLGLSAQDKTNIARMLGRHITG